MNKQVKSFFKNYEQNMKPDVDLGLLRSKVASLKNPKPKHRFSFSLTKLVSGLVVLVVVVISGFIISMFTHKSYEDLPKDINIWEYLEQQFGDDYEIVLSEKNIANGYIDNLQIFIFKGTKTGQNYLVVYILNNENNPDASLSVLDNNMEVLKIDTAKNPIGMFILEKQRLDLDLVLSIDNQIFSKQVQLQIDDNA